MSSLAGIGGGTFTSLSIVHDTTYALCSTPGCTNPALANSSQQAVPLAH